jgi:hypothetical protein
VSGPRRSGWRLCALLCLAGPAAPATEPGEPRAAGQIAGQEQEQPPASRSLAARAAGSLKDAALRLFRAPEPHAEAGNEKAAKGDVAGALAELQSAEAQAKSPEAKAALAFDRSAALLRGPKEGAPAALEQALEAERSTSRPLQAKSAYHAALALEAGGKKEEAIAAYARTLALDAQDEDAKVNLELLLLEQRRQRQQDQKQDQQKQRQQAKQEPRGEGSSQPPQQGPKEAPKEAPKETSKNRPAPGRKDEPQPQQPAEQPREQTSGRPSDPQQSQQPGPQLGRSDAQRLLDAAKAGEKNLQTWRFNKPKQENRRRPQAEKDW